MESLSVQRLLLLWMLLVCSGLLWAQVERNPFDLQVEGAEEQEVSVGSDNPFDLVAVAPRPLAPQTLPRNKEEAQELLHFQRNKSVHFSETTVYRQKFIISVLLVVFLGFLITVFRRGLKHLYEAFVNENMLALLLREQTKGIQQAYWLFYLLFFLSAGFALYLISNRLGLYLPLLPLGQWLFYSMIVFGIFVIKHLLLAVVGLVFPLSKPLLLYSFTILVFNCILGLYLVPMDILLALGSAHLQQLVFYLLLGGVGLLYVYRILRSFFIAAPYALNYPMHFLLYLCAVEIAPVLILWRLVTSWQG